LEELNALPVEEKKKYLRKEAPTIRKAIGEAVPTSIFQQIARNIKGQSSLLLNN
jgi:DNA (cytosine-5)-methyltransferase 1